MKQQKVIFRTWESTGNPVAIFPDVQINQFNPEYSLLLDAAGNRCSCIPSNVIENTRPATTDEIISLLAH